MARAEQYICDNCGKVVAGFEKSNEVKGKYLQIRGTFVIEDWDKKNDRRIYWFLTPARDAEIVFCNSECLEAFMQTKEKEFKKKYKEDCEAGLYDRGYYTPPKEYKDDMFGEEPTG